MNPARTFFFDAPRALSVQTLQLKYFEAAGLQAEANSSGISAGTVRRLGDGTMPPFPCLVYPQSQKMMIEWQA